MTEEEYRPANLAKGTEHMFLRGKCKWCRTDKVDQWGNWKITLYPDQDSLMKMQALKGRGLKNALKKDDDGYYMQFNRPSQKTIKGKVVAFQPPEVFNADGTTPLRDVYIGNGSDVTIKLETYGGKFADKSWYAARLRSIRVDNLVPYEKNRDLFPEQMDAIAGLEDQPKHVDPGF